MAVTAVDQSSQAKKADKKPLYRYSVQHLSTPNSGAIEVVALASELDRKAQTAAASSSFGIEAGVIYLPHLSSPRVTEIESFADAFILFQQNNMSYRKFIICHADNERISQELYGSVSLSHQR